MRVVAQEKRFTARVRVAAVTKHDVGKVVTLEAVVGGDGNPNVAWAKRSPKAKFEISVTQPAAEGSFEHNQQFDIVFNPIE